MDKKIVQQITERMRSKDTEELKQILSAHDTSQWSEEAFEAIKQVLASREAKLSMINSMNTAELLTLWSDNDRGKYSTDEFLSIKQILIDRGVTPPEQHNKNNQPVDESKNETIKKLKTQPYLLAATLSFVEWALTTGGIFYLITLLLDQLPKARFSMVSFVPSIAIGYGFVGFFCTKRNLTSPVRVKAALAIAGIIISISSSSLVMWLSGVEKALGQAFWVSIIFIGGFATILILVSQFKYEGQRMSIFTAIRAIFSFL